MLKFPSLTGVIRFLINWWCAYISNVRFTVSVPYRGYSFFNLVHWFNWCYRNVSVPYRGYSFFNQCDFSDRIDKSNIVVSVPYRGYSFFNLVHWFNWCYRNVSVPYRGYSFFNQCDFSDRIDKSNIVVSVPYRGYSFFNWRTKKQQKTQKQRFRPLQGLFVF